ncbi:MAG: PAS domain-containing protein, partial [Rhizobacter sp.]
MQAELPSNVEALLVAQTVDAVIFADVSGFIRLWNGAASELFGFSAQEAIRASLDLVIPEPLRSAHWRGYNAAIATGRTRLRGRPTLTKGLHRTGRSLYVEMSFSLIANTSGAIIGSV